MHKLHRPGTHIDLDAIKTRSDLPKYVMTQDERGRLFVLARGEGLTHCAVSVVPSVRYGEATIRVEFDAGTVPFVPWSKLKEIGDGEAEEVHPQQEIADLKKRLKDARTDVREVQAERDEANERVRDLRAKIDSEAGTQVVQSTYRHELEGLLKRFRPIVDQAQSCVTSYNIGWQDMLAAKAAYDDAQRFLEAEAAKRPDDFVASFGQDGPFLDYFRRQIEWSRETFGPALRTQGVIDHIRKELHEIEADPRDLSEWLDVAVLALDGYWRHGGKPERVLTLLEYKQARNKARTWPDRRTRSENEAIEHDRSAEAAE